MARRREAKKRVVLPDPKYGSVLASNFINYLMQEGKKSIAEKIFYGAMDEIGKKSNTDPLDVFNQAMENVKPLLEVKSRRVGGATYQVPIEVSSRRQNTLAMRWIVGFARKRKGVASKTALTSELLDAYNKTGSAMKKREETHKMAEANKAFAHYKW